MSRNHRTVRRAGASMESRTADYLRWALDDDRVERRHPTGVRDRGDIAGVRYRGRRIVIECKNTARLTSPASARSGDGTRQRRRPDRCGRPETSRHRHRRPCRAGAAARAHDPGIVRVIAERRVAARPRRGGTMLIRGYLPRCRSCGVLHKPTNADTAHETARRHIKAKPGHSVGVIPIRIEERKRP